VIVDLEQLLQQPPFGLDARAKRSLYRRALSALTDHHCERSPEYRRAVQLLGYRPGAELDPEQLPYIPVRLFKEFELRSVDRGEVVKTMTSSGTTGQAVSRIFLDRQTASAQTKVLVRIVSSFTGTKRLPFLIADTPAVTKDRALFSARGAGILGFSMLGHDQTYLLDDAYAIDDARLAAFQERHRGQRVLVFGFTFIVWEHVCQALRRAGRRLELEGILIHGGGWKKLAALAVDNATFRGTVRETTGIAEVSNYYGMVEQTGSIFMECPEGYLHASIFSDVIVRDPVTFAPLGPGKTGLLQLLSLLPASYPGHSILTEDLGEIVGVDDCPCGRMGTRFRVHGRIKDAEVRGCSDTHAPPR
jgi:hypothetical protein